MSVHFSGLTCNFALSVHGGAVKSLRPPQIISSLSLSLSSFHDLPIYLVVRVTKIVGHLFSEIVSALSHKAVCQAMILIASWGFSSFPPRICDRIVQQRNKLFP